MTRFFDEMTEMVGENVTVTLSETDPRAVVTGQLMSLSDHGQAIVRTEDGEVHYCWPALGVERVSV